MRNFVFKVIVQVFVFLQAMNVVSATELIANQIINGSVMRRYFSTVVDQVWNRKEEKKTFSLKAETIGTEIGSALIELGENYGQNTFIGIYAINSVEVSPIDNTRNQLENIISFDSSSG